MLALTRVLLARPDRMDWGARDFLRYGDDRPHIVAEDAAAERATDEGLVKVHLGRIHAGLVGGNPEGLLRLLRRMPDLDPIGRHQGGAVQRLHRRLVGEWRDLDSLDDLVLTVDPLGVAGLLLDLVTRPLQGVE